MAGDTQKNRSTWSVPLDLGNDGAICERYELRSRIAEGGFGDVYRATQRSTGQDVAIKVLRLEGAGEASAQLARFHRETRLCAALNHPNIVHLIDSGTLAAGSVFAVFEFARGDTLADVLAAEGSLEPAEAIHLMSQVLDALACAHAEGVIHRDLKPANIMVTHTGARRNALVLDFGLSTLGADARLGQSPRVTLTGEYLGTPGYSAPEQLRGELATPASDLFAWGLITLECLTGEPALDGTMAQIIHGLVGPEPVPIPALLLNQELGRILTAVTQKDASRRAGSARRVLTEIQKMHVDPRLTRDAIACSRRTRPQLANMAPASVKLSPTWLVPLRRNPNFTGREQLLAELETTLRQRGRLAIAALRGLGGVGKTQLALEYAYRHAHEYRLVAWLRAEEAATLTEDVSALAAALDLPERDTPDQRRKVDAVRDWLEQHDDWLLIYDNAPNPDSIRRFLPRSASGHILLTSRHQSWRHLGASVAVEELGPEEAVEFLLARTGECDREMAAKLAEELGRLPLALEGASAYVETTGRSLATYLLLLRDQRKVLLESPPAGDYPATLGSAWELSFRQVEQELQEAADLLRLCAFFAPEHIPFTLLAGGGKHLPDPLAKAASDPIQLDACVAALRHYSLVKVEGDGLFIHRLVQLVTRERLPDAERPRWAERALRVAEACFPKSGTAGDFHPEAGRLLPHALAALSHAEALPSCAVPAGRLLNRTAGYLSARGFFDQAVPCMGRALRLLEQAPEPRDDDIAEVLSDRGLVLYALGDLSQACASIERALAIRERLKGPDDFFVATELIKLAFVLRHLGELGRVRDCALRAIRILEQVLGPGHALEAMALSVLCRALWQLGEVSEARRAADRALATLATSDLFHPLICSCWYNLGHVELDLGNLDCAEQCIAQALEIGERAYGTHSLTVASLAVRGAIQERRGDLEESRDSFERSLAGAVRVCNLFSEEIALARSQLADVLRRLGKHEEALATLRHTKDAMDRVCGQRSRLESHLEATTAALLVDQGHPGQARHHAEAALAALDSFYPAAHPYRIPVLNLMAGIEHAQGENARAGELAERALAIGDNAFGGLHPDLAECHAVLAAVAAEKGDDAAERHHQEQHETLHARFSSGPLVPSTHPARKRQ